MKYSVIILTALLAASMPAVEVGPYKVTEVVDGNTIKVMTEWGEHTIRMLYIDTPEGDDAKTILEILIKKSPEVMLWGPGEQLQMDSLDQILADPIVRNWGRMSLFMVKHGLTPYVRKYGDAPDFLHKELLAAHDTAKKENKIFWRTNPEYMNSKVHEQADPNGIKIKGVFEPILPPKNQDKH